MHIRLNFQLTPPIDPMNLEFEEKNKIWANI